MGTFGFCCSVAGSQCPCLSVQTRIRTQSLFCVVERIRRASNCWLGLFFPRYRDPRSLAVYEDWRLIVNMPLWRQPLKSGGVLAWAQELMGRRVGSGGTNAPACFLREGCGALDNTSHTGKRVPAPGAPFHGASPGGLSPG